MNRDINEIEDEIRRIVNRVGIDSEDGFQLCDRKFCIHCRNDLESDQECNCGGPDGYLPLYVKVNVCP